MGKFRVNDRVVVVNGDGRLKNGFTGTVVAVPEWDYGRHECITVEIDPEFTEGLIKSRGRWFASRFDFVEDGLDAPNKDISSLLFG